MSGIARRSSHAALATAVMMVAAAWWLTAERSPRGRKDAGVTVVSGPARRDVVAEPSPLSSPAASAASSPAPAALEPSSPAFAGSAGLDSEPASMHARVRSEARDPGWAPVNEQALGTGYAAIAGLHGAPPRIRCATSLCEVAGAINDKAMSAYNLNAAVGALHGPELADAMERRGLQAQGVSFSDDGGRLVFHAYYRRR